MSRCLRSRIVPLVILQFWIKLVSALFFSTLLSAIFGALLARDGSPAIGNTALLDFARTPWGILTLLILPVAYLSINYFEYSCVLRVFADPQGGVVDALFASLIALPKLLWMAVIQTLVGLVLLAPFLLLAGLTYWILLTDADINFYLANRPPKFILAIAIGVLLSAFSLAVLGLLLLRWFHALPRLVFESRGTIETLRLSWRETSNWPIILMAILVWFGIFFCAYLVVPVLLSWVTATLFNYVDHDSDGSIMAAMAILLLHTTILSIIGAASQCWLAAAIWTTYDRPLPTDYGTTKRSALTQKLWIRPLLLVSASTLVGLAIGLTAFQQVLNFTVRQQVQIVAHRAGSKGFPENSLSALQHAIGVKSDCAEIDVQLSKDGTVYVAHDRDLRRTAGLPMVLSESRDEELAKADMGSQATPPFPTEPLATFDEFLQKSANQIRLSVELKYYGFQPKLAEKVLELLKKHPSNPAHEIISLEYQALEQVAKLDPNIRRGFLVSASVGDITKLNVNFLSVSKNAFSPELLERAQKRDMQVAVWTVNDREEMFRLMVRGADLIVTDDPALAVEVAREYHELSKIELLLVRLRESLSR